MRTFIPSQTMNLASNKLNGTIPEDWQLPASLQVHMP